MIEFFVHGHPETAGSKRAFILPIKEKCAFIKGATAADVLKMTEAQRESLLKPQKLCQAIVTDDNPDGDAWKELCAAAARAVYAGPPLEGPLQLDVTFILHRPQSHYGTGKNEGKVKESAPAYPTTRPDATKLLRCLEDGLTGVIYVDDSQIVAQHVFKVFGPEQGARVQVDHYAPTELF